MRTRLIIIACLISSVFLAVVIRLVDIMLLNHSLYVQMAKMQQIKIEEIPIKRGLIFDRKGRELAINVDMESIYCNPSEIGESQIHKVATELSTIMGKDRETVLSKLKANSKFSWIERKVSPEIAEKIKNSKIKGVGLITESKRFYPKGSLASHLIGYVDIDNKGIEGIESKYDRELTAVNQATVSYYRDAKGNLLSKGVLREIRGNNIILTIDEGLQFILERNLDEAVRQWRASYASAIMMDPFTGEILAMANSPSFNLNNPATVKADMRKNRAITDCYEPGSTFKIIVGAAALEEGLVKPNIRYDCSAGYIEVGGKRIKDVHRHGVLTFQEVIQKSSNVGTIKIALSLGKERLYEYIKKFGFGEKTGIDIIGEVSGWVRPPAKWSGMSIGSIAIGQEVAATPLQILRAYSVIANGGLLVKPYLVSEIQSPEGVTLYKAVPETKRVLREETTMEFKSILTTVTEVGGTAKEASVDGNIVAGKTGTAQKFDPITKRYSKINYVSSFVGFVPVDKPKIALIVVVHDPKGHIYGGIVAAPIFRKIANDALSYLEVPRDDVKDKNILVTSTR
ncbi:MAG: penicillin-binding protein 2 [Thermodesulfovibrionales bacterium]|nr:penicillin-binding protein 2 [Thermodesulfovibrionales bacterium]